jgi:nitrite reductase (NO-forming)
VSIPAVNTPHPAATDAEPASKALLDHGRKVYAEVCAACHQADGQGLPNVFPPLAQSDYLMADAERAVRVLLQGLSGPITVNGKQFQGAMPKLPLTDRDIAGVLSYVRGNFGNRGAPVRLADVDRIRAALGSTAKQSDQVATAP